MKNSPVVAELFFHDSPHDVSRILYPDSAHGERRGDDHISWLCVAAGLMRANFSNLDLVEERCTFSRQGLPRAPIARAPVLQPS